MSELSIGEVSTRAGIRASAIRYYESIGLLKKAARSGGRRRFDETVVQRLAVITFARSIGFSLKDLVRLFGGKVHWRELATRKLSEVRSIIVKSRLMARILEDGLRCDCLDLTTCAKFAQRIKARRKL